MKPQEFDPSNIEFTKFKKLDNGANVMYLNYNSKPIHLTTPELELPFDTNFWADTNSKGDETGKWAVRCNINKTKENQGLIDSLKQMDDIIMKKAVENSVEWFRKKHLSMEAVEALYNPQIKEDLDPETGEPTGKYPPSFNFKVIKREGQVTCKIFSDGKKEVNVNNSDQEDYVDMNNLLKKGSKVKLLIRCNGLWSANGKFGCTWRAEQLKVKVSENFDECVFDDSDDDQEIERIDENFVESSDEEDGGGESGGGESGGGGSKGESGESDGESVEKPVKKVRKVRKN